jgi:hypothetical protein
MPGDIDMMKHWMRGLWLVAALISSFGIAAAAASAQGLSGQRLITVHIAGDEFRIPRGYFYPFPPREENPGGLLIHAFLPALSAVWGHEKEEFDVFPEGRLSRAVIILGMDANHTTTLEFRLHVHKDDIGAPYDQQPSRYGLEVHTPAQLGIINKGRERDEIYVDRGEGALAGFITCNLDGRVPAPGCTHNFLYRNRLMQITYRKPYLPQWRSIEQKVKDLLDSFMRQASLIGPQRRV